MDLSLDIRDEVRAALSDGKPVVARPPVNLQVAHALEGVVRAAGATPATVGVIGGRLRVGLESGDIERLGCVGPVLKCAAGDRRSRHLPMSWRARAPDRRG